MIESHDVHLIFNDRDKDAVARIDQELRNRGLIPWFWDRDGGANWYQEEVDSIQENTPVSAIFLGPAGWGPNYHTKLTTIACQAARPTIFVLLPGWRRDDLNQFPELTKRRWVEFKSLDDQSTLKALAQRVVDDAYELAGEAGSQQTGTAVAAGRRLMVYIPARSQTVESWISLRDRLSKEPELAGCSWIRHEYSAGVWSRDALDDLAAELSGAIDGVVADDRRGNANPFQHITLMGHSFGGVLARIAYLIAAGKYPDKLNAVSTCARPSGLHRAVRRTEPRNREEAFRVARPDGHRTALGQVGTPDWRPARRLRGDHESAHSVDTLLCSSATDSCPGCRSVARQRRMNGSIGTTASTSYSFPMRGSATFPERHIPMCIG